MSDQPTDSSRQAGDRPDVQHPDDVSAFAAAHGFEVPDQVVSDGELAALEQMETAELRVRRQRLERAEEAVSYTRRLLQGRLDLVRAELARRDDPAAGDLLDGLAHILAGDERGSSDPAQARATRVRVPEDADRYASLLDRLVGDTQIRGSLSELPVDQLEGLVARYSGVERSLSSLRRALFDRIDALRDELAARYKDGRADVSELLS